MKRIIPPAVALILAAWVASAAWADGAPRFDTAMSFQPGATVYPLDGHAEAFFTMGFNTSRGLFNMWSGLGGTVQVQGTATTLRYPWMLTVASVQVVSLGSGAFTLRPQVTLPWSVLSYKAPGIGLIARGDIRLGGSRGATPSLIVQAEANYFPPLLGNPWSADAAAAGVDVGEKYWMLGYGGYVKLKASDALTFGIDARLESDNCAYFAGGTYHMLTNADVAAIVELRGLAFRAGIILNGWNQQVVGESRRYVILPSFSIILGEVPFFL